VTVHDARAPHSSPRTRPFIAARYGVRLALRFGFRRVLGGVDAEESVYLILGQWPVARGRSHDEITHQLDLGLEVIICEVVALAFGWRHAPNLRTSGHWLHQLPQLSVADLPRSAQASMMLRRAGSASRHVAARGGLIWDPGLPRPDAEKL
jgi:hypothetical protein